MTVTADAGKTGNKVVVTAKGTLPEVTKPLYAYVGVVDLAVELAKELPAELKKLQPELQTNVTKVTEFVQTLPTTVKALAEVYGDKATARYNELAVRGERLVGAIRRQPATQAAIAEGKDAVKKAEQAASSAKRAAKAGEKAAEDAAEKIG
jgi:hypothetical protein